MKKIVVLLFISCLLVSGCSVVRVSNNFDSAVKTILSDNNKLYNVYFEGYKYYVPNGLKFINKEEYNASLSDRFNNKYYLYVDIISYYHKVEKDYKEKSSKFYSKKINLNSKNGYLDIQEKNGKYFVQFMYNYAKIEVYTDKSHLDDVVCNASYLLKSIKYNDKILDSLIGDNKLNYKEETFNIFQTEAKKDTFLNYVEEYDNGSTKTNTDEDSIKINSDSES